MINWLKQKFLNRYLKSGIRYLLMLLVGALVGSTLPGLSELAALILERSDAIVNLTASIISGLVIYWSTRKNRVNAKISRGSK